MKNIRPLLSYKEIAAARQIAKARLKEITIEILQQKLVLIFTAYLNKKAKVNLSVLKFELDKLEEHLIAIDNTYYSQVQFIEFNLDTNYPNI